jgi:hypothetical protein
VSTVTLRPSGLRFLERFGALRLRDIEEALRSLSLATRASLSAALTSAVAELDREPEEVSGSPLVARRTRRRP